MGGSDSVREKGIEYVSVSLMDMRHKLFIPSLENEQCLVELVKKVSLHLKFFASNSCILELIF